MRTWVSSSRRSRNSACPRTRWSWSCTTAADGVMRRHKFSLASLTSSCGGGGGAEGEGGRGGAFAGRCYPLLSPAPRRDMLSCHAQAPLYLNVARVLAGGGRHGVQVGRRKRRGSLQRPAAPERAENERAGGADLQGGRYARDARRTARAARLSVATAV